MKAVLLTPGIQRKKWGEWCIWRRGGQSKNLIIFHIMHQFLMLHLWIFYRYSLPKP